MPQDAYTLRYLCGELDKIFCGGKINRIVQPSADEVVFTVYNGKTTKLLVDVNPAAPRIGITEKEKESPLTAPNFCMLLRKHLLSATVRDISLVGFDRIVKIDLSPSSEFFDEGEKTLYVELMGRYSNIILTENGKVLGGNRGINFFDNGVRPLIVGREYLFPPVGDKKVPKDEALSEILCGDDAKELAKSVTENVQGIAPSTATEMAEQYFAEHGVFSGKSFFVFMNDFLYAQEYSPCVITDKGAVKDVCVFPYKCVSGEVKNFPTLVLAEEFYFNEKNRIKKFAALKERLTSAASAALKKANKRLSAINAREKDAASADLNRLKGELILANIYKFKGGEKSCVLDNYYDGTTVEIELDERISAAANSERYYKKYNKQKRALAALALQREAAESEADYLESVLDFIGMAENICDLAEIKEELINARIISEKNNVRRRTTEPTLGRVYDVYGFTVRVGRNNAENDKIAFSAKPDDIWLHAKNFHSSHVVIETRGTEPREKTLIAAAEICAYYSGGRSGGKTEIVYTRRKFLKKPRGAKLGFCTYTDFKSVTVMPEKHAEFLKSRDTE